MNTGCIAIFVTCSSLAEARRIVGSLLKKRLVACGNILSGAESRFRWAGKVDKAAEVVLMLKTLSKNFRSVEREVRRIHSYEVPEIIAFPIISGSRNYLRWIKESVS
ncbi:MAG: divalent-cation tolerance protein CutA [Candidatus Omnitrophica bacterium]|nr:divalent-cation tolerance protein CutA [Candidatus Omnitrophota bacterium]MCM8790499.1 divalent-cation tolerance protein CutA [Candidatus Omnitrophota bacterium]